MAKPAPVLSVDEQLAAIRRVRPTTRAEAVKRSGELIRLAAIKRRAEREAADAEAAKRVMDDATAPAEFTEEVLLALAKSVGEFVKETVAPLKERIAELESRPVLQDAGIWREHTVYNSGAVVSYRGSAWVCHEANSNARPGKSNAWRLMVKSDQK
jgi:hypothetical protein